MILLDLPRFISVLSWLAKSFVAVGSGSVCGMVTGVIFICLLLKLSSWYSIGLGTIILGAKKCQKIQHVCAGFEEL